MLKCKVPRLVRSNQLKNQQTYRYNSDAFSLQSIFKRRYSGTNKNIQLHLRLAFSDVLGKTQRRNMVGVGTAIGMWLLLNILDDAEASETNDEEYVIEKATKTKFPKVLKIGESTFDIAGVGVRTVTLFKFNTYSMALYELHMFSDSISYVDLPTAIAEMGNKWNLHTAQEISGQQTFFDDIIFSQYHKILRVVPSHTAQGSHLAKGFSDNLKPRVKELLRMKHLNQFTSPSKTHQQDQVNKTSTNYFNFAYTNLSSDITQNTQLMKQIDSQVETELNEIIQAFENCFPAKRNFYKGILVDFVCSTHSNGKSPNNQITNRNVNNVMDIYVDNQLAGKINSPEICVALFDVYCGAKAKTPELKPIIAEGLHKILYK